MNNDNNMSKTTTKAPSKSVSSLNALVEPPKQLNLNLKPLMGDKVYKVTVKDSSSVFSLKLAIQKQCGLSLERQNLLYDNVILADDKKLSSYNIEDGAMLLILPQMRSGPLDFRVNTQALQQFVRRVNTNVVETKKLFESKTGGGLNRKDFFMITLRPDGGITIVSAKNNKASSVVAKSDVQKETVNEEVDLETLEASNKRTRQKMAEIRRRTQESKEKRKNHRLSKLAEAVATNNDHGMSMAFVDAETIVDEDDWNKLMNLMAEKKEQPEAPAVEITNVFVDIRQPTSIVETVGVASNEPVDASSMVFAVKTAAVASSTEEVPRTVVKGTEKDVDDDDDSSEKSEIEGFFDCQEIENDSTLWKCFVDWLYLAVFHYRLKYFSNTVSGEGSAPTAAASVANTPTVSKDASVVNQNADAKISKDKK